MTETENRWVKTARDQLQGRRIVHVRYMRHEEADSLGWHTRPVVLVLDDGNLVFPAADEEGNDAGTLYTNNEQNPVLPVI